MKLLVILSVWIWVSASVSADGQLQWTEADSKQVSTTIEAGTYQSVTSVLILRHGRPVYEAYFRDANDGTLHDTRSVTKTVMSMAVGVAVQQGYLKDQQVKVASYFPDYAALIESDARKANITVEDLLTMSNPLECDDWNNFSRGNEERMYLVEDPVRFFWSLPPRDYPTWVMPPEKQPFGRAYSYCTAGVQVLGMMLKRAVAEPITDFVEREVFEPAGVTDFRWQYSGSGVPALGGGLLMSARSLAKLAELQRLEGRVAGQLVFSKEWSQTSVSPKASIPPHNQWQYGYLWWLQEYRVGAQTYTAAAMSGNGGNKIWVLPEFGLTIVFTKTDYGTRGMHEAAQAFFENEIVKRLH